MKTIYTLAIQFGTLSVSAAICEHSGDRRRIIEVIRRPLPHHLKTSADDLVRTSLTECYAILGLLRKKHRTICPSLIRVGVSSPYVLSRTENVEKPFGDARVFVNEDVDELQSLGKQQFFDALPEHDALLVIESLPMSFSVNGYATRHAIGQTGKTLAASIRYSAIPQAFAKAVENRVQGFGCPMILTYHTGVVLYRSLLMPQLGSESAVLILDVGGEVSEASIIIDEVIKDVATIPIGVGDLLARIEAEFHSDSASVTSLFHQYLLDQLMANDRDRIDEILHTVVGEWKGPLDAFIREHPELLERDSAIFIIGGGALAADMKALIQTLSVFQEHQSAKLYTVDPFAYREQFDGDVDFRGPEDMGLLALCLTS